MTGAAQSVRRLCAVYAALLVLLALTAGSTALPPGWWSNPISLGIAFAKAFLVFYSFMRLRNQSWLVRLFALAGAFWLMILLALTASDFLTRGWG